MNQPGTTIIGPADFRAVPLPDRSVFEPHTMSCGCVRRYALGAVDPDGLGYDLIDTLIITCSAHTARRNDQGRRRLSAAMTTTMTTTQQAGNYDSRADTLIHSQRVGELLGTVIKDLLDRSYCHDRSKMEPPERETFDKYTLATLTFGTAGYYACLEEMRPALEHHYAQNRHHPQAHADGVRGMTLTDILEMLADWKAATERVSNGDLERSLVINQERFGISADLAAILRNTAGHFGWLGRDGRANRA